ncbi:MAG TPA: TonB-dependent receptor [Bacteroidales bacterium]|nr:TonB-dependent receptor [Bacteroidales bacterium]
MGRLHCFLFFFFGFVSLHSFLLSQDMPVKEVNPVIVESNRKFFTDDQIIRNVIVKPALAEQYTGLAEMLGKTSSVNIRNYGAAGSLASISMQGTGSNHTLVTWNGIPLNSPTTGQADLSLIPTAFVQSVDVINGASGSLFGSGTFGGTVNLDNQPDWNNRASAQYIFNAGSFGSFGNHLFLKAGNRHLQYQLSAMQAVAKNDFRYRDHYRFEDPYITNSHNAYRSFGLLQNAWINLEKAGTIEAGIWYQLKSLQLPALMGSYKSSQADQKDSVFRTFVNYSKKWDKSALTIRTAYLSDFLNYRDKSETDSTWTLDSKIATSRFISEADYRIFITSNLVAGGGINYNYLAGRSNNYGGLVKENEYALYGGLKYILKKIILNTAVRKTFYEGLNPDPQFSAGIRYQVSDRFNVRSAYSTKFRRPGFNEKYWRPGGNPELNPEKGRGVDISFEYTCRDAMHQTDAINRVSTAASRSSFINARITGYYQTVDNWIQWIMRDSITPVEYKKVKAGGIESWIDFGVTSGDYSINGSLNYNFHHSVIARTFDDKEIYRGKQLIYTPRHTFRMNTEIHRKGIMAGVFTSYTGKRETVETADRAVQLPSYWTIDLTTGIEKQINQIPIALFFRVENILDQSYEVIRSYPMPGRSYHITASVGFSHNQSK